MCASVTLACAYYDSSRQLSFLFLLTPLCKRKTLGPTSYFFDGPAAPSEPAHFSTCPGSRPSFTPLKGSAGDGTGSEKVRSTTKEAVEESCILTVD